MRPGVKDRKALRENVLAVCGPFQEPTYNKLIKRCFAISKGEPNSTVVKLNGAHNWICAMNHDLGGQSVVTFGGSESDAEA